MSASNHAKGFGAVKGRGSWDQGDSFLASVDDVPTSESVDSFLDSYMAMAGDTHGSTSSSVGYAPCLSQSR